MNYIKQNPASSVLDRRGINRKDMAKNYPVTGKVTAGLYIRFLFVCNRAETDIPLIAVLIHP